MRNNLIRFSGLAALIASVGLLPEAAANDPNPAAEARDTLDRWVETRRQQADEESRWRQQEAFLRQSLTLLGEEKALLEDRLTGLRETTGVQRERREALEAENEALRAAADRFQTALNALETETAAFARYFPRPLADRVQTQINRLGTGGDAASTLPHRFQALLGILGEANRFHQTVTVVREAVPRPDGSQAEVTVLYLGLAQAWFVNDTGDFAGRGLPAADGWAWRPDPAIAASVQRAVAIQENRRAAELVTLPFALTELP